MVVLSRPHHAANGEYSPPDKLESQASIEPVEPVPHRRAFLERDGRSDVLEADQIERRIARDPVDLSGGQKPFVPDEIGHSAGPGTGGLALQPFDDVEAGRRPRLDQDE